MTSQRDIICNPQKIKLPYLKPNFAVDLSKIRSDVEFSQGFYKETRCLRNTGLYLYPCRNEKKNERRKIIILEKLDITANSESLIRIQGVCQVMKINLI